MGMDYRHAGSASYPRFEDELRRVAAALGCRETARLGELKEASEKKPFGYWFGCMYGTTPAAPSSTYRTASQKP